jgi:hypothetical protein
VIVSTDTLAIELARKYIRNNYPSYHFEDSVFVNENDSMFVIWYAPSKYHYKPQSPYTVGIRKENGCAYWFEGLL